MIQSEGQDFYFTKDDDGLFDVLLALAKIDCEPNLHACPGGDAVAVMINCNDLFFWACADGEPVVPADLPILDEVLRELHSDVNEPTRHYDKYTYSESLFCCKKRKMRPQNCILVKYPDHIRPLFEKCGPVRTDKECG